MSKWHPIIPDPLTEIEMESILEGALRLLAGVGVACAHEETVRRLLDWDGTAYRDGRIRFAPEKLRSRLEGRRVPARSDDGGFALGACWACLNFCDPETGAVRPASSEEVARMCRLWDARGISSVVPLLPGDVPPGLATLRAEQIALTHSKGLGGYLTVLAEDEVRYLIEMNRAAGRTYRLMEQVAISPLRFNDEGLATALIFLDEPDVEVTLGGAIPMAGVTCPLDPRAALVQSTAEALAYDSLCAALGTSGGLSLRIEPFDFATSAIVFGSPEWCLYRALALQMTGYLNGSAPTSGSFRTVSKRPDAQAATERTASALWQALLGIRHFGAVGQLSVDEIFSPQQAVLDREILTYVERVVRGLEWDASSPDALELIAEGVESGSFAATDDTALRYRDFYAFPALFRYRNIGRWRADGEPDILKEAWLIAREEIARSTFRLPDDRQREVDRIYEEASRRIRG